MRRIEYLNREEFEKKLAGYTSKLTNPEDCLLVDTELADKGIQNFVTRDTVYVVK